MTKTWKTRLLSLALCLALLVSCLPFTAFAETAENVLDMTEGDVITAFAEEGTVWTSDDPSIAWVDETGSLNALKPGTVTVTDGQTDYTVNVSDYDDGTPIVGNLKILARYNDSMQFYDGHVYLLFTSYQDGIEITVPDLYAGYEIKDTYYDEISEDISNGSNHVGQDAVNYFTFNKEMKTATVDRGEIVTIGMYRDFDLTVPQAAIGCIQNSTLWGGLSAAGKADIIEAVFGFLSDRSIPGDEAFARVKAILDAEGLDYNMLLDGVVDGGVCFNRELYNQKLEWDQYENVTYEMDITEAQLRLMTMYLGGNLNKFSILKNSCATVALRAWNAAVGTRNGEPSAYYLTSTADGIFSIIDAPKGVRDNIVSRLPGYYLNNAEGVAEPDAGYQDETGWVYVSAPEKVTPLNVNYDEGAVSVDEDFTELKSLIKAAKAGKNIYYNKEEQDIDVKVNLSVNGESATINSVDFTVNDTDFSIDGSNIPEDGIWFKVAADAPADGEAYYVTDADGKAIASYYNGEVLSFCAKTLPLSFNVETGEQGVRNLLKITVENGDKAKAETEVYIKDGENKIPLESMTEVESGTDIYIKANVAADETEYTLSTVSFNSTYIYDNDYFDADEQAFVVTMPSGYSDIEIIYEKAIVKAVDGNFAQIAVGDTLSVYETVEMLVGDDYGRVDQDLVWNAIDSEGVVEIEGSELTAVGEGSAVLWVCAKGNAKIGIFFTVMVYDSLDDMVKVVYSDDTLDNAQMMYSYNGGEKAPILFSGFMVKKGSELYVTATPAEGKAVLYEHANDSTIWPDEPFVLTEDTEIEVRTVDAAISNMPKEVRMSSKGDEYQLNLSFGYTGLYALLPVYDDRIEYMSTDTSMVTVDETGLITVVGDIPEGGDAVYVFAAAASSDVYTLTKVVLGDYDGDKIVGSITISARRIAEGELVAHGALTFNTYQDLDLDISYYDYYKTNDKYNDLMIDYDQHPENYTEDPALYNENILGLSDRESYFDAIYHGAESEPDTVSLLAGESISVSNYSFDSTNLNTIRKALEGSISSSEEIQELVRQMILFEDGQQIDGVVAFDTFVVALQQMYATTGVIGYNPADGHSIGGMDVNREIYNQFRRNDSQMPNNFYTVEITADELGILKAYLKDPSNNFYNLFNKNCASGVVHIWNTVLASESDLHLTSNMSGIATDPQSLYFDLGLLTLKKGINPLQRGYGGSDFYPRTVRYSDALKEVIAMIDSIGEVEYTEDCKNALDSVREAYEALNELEKDRVYNYGELIDAELDYEELQKDAELAADKETFAQYLQDKIQAADSLAQEGDSAACGRLINIAKAVLGAMDYNENRSLEENEAAADTVINGLAIALNLQREFDRQRATEAPTEPTPVEDAIVGDVNGDGVVNNRDAMILDRFIGGWEGYAERITNMDAADLNRDYEVNNRDAMILDRYVAGHEGYDKYIVPLVPLD